MGRKELQHRHLRIDIGQPADAWPYHLRATGISARRGRNLRASRDDLFTLRGAKATMKIEAVDFFYLSMPEVTTEADGSQDALMVRVAAGGHVGWGECEPAPLPSIAAAICPRSHGACQPVLDSVLGQTLDDVADIKRI